MHEEVIAVKPALLSALDPQQRISSKWIAKECGKMHKNVIRDIAAYAIALKIGYRITEHCTGREVLSRLVDMLDVSYRENGNVNEIKVTIEFAKSLLNNYNAKHTLSANLIARTGDRSGWSLKGVQ